jgi:formate dehydrogenase maturation protein FdhE
MSDTPVYDVEAEFARIRREYGGLGDGAWAAAKWFAEALVRSRAELERQRVQDVNALMEDIRKGDEMLMAWFKAASPYATPGSLEEGLRKRALLSTDCHCPSCGHNRCKSSVSSIDNDDGTHYCQRCSAEWREI